MVISIKLASTNKCLEQWPGTWKNHTNSSTQACSPLRNLLSLLQAASSISSVCTVMLSIRQWVPWIRDSFVISLCNNSSSYYSEITQMLEFNQTAVSQHQLHIEITWEDFNMLPGPQARPTAFGCQRMGLRLQYRLKLPPGDSNTQTGLRTTELNPRFNLNPSTF